MLSSSFIHTVYGTAWPKNTVATLHFHDDAVTWMRQTDKPNLQQDETPSTISATHIVNASSAVMTTDDGEMPRQKKPDQSQEGYNNHKKFKWLPWGGMHPAILKSRKFKRTRLFSRVRSKITHFRIARPCVCIYDLTSFNINALSPRPLPALQNACPSSPISEPS